jgi:DNA-binding transcriptional LysR family regulator
MNDRQIECFLEAARCLNFTRAAENLTLPQPAVSRYIASLESELDAKLFTRESNRKIVLTSAGKAYFNLFQRTANELAHAKNALSATTEVLHLGINIGWSSSDYLPKVVRICQQRNPRFRISYECLPFHELTSALREKRLDAVIALENYLMHSLEFETERFTSLQRTILFSKGLPNYEQIKNPADFYPYDFLIADDPLIRHLVQESEEMFRSFHFMPRYRALPNQETVHFYVENGLGVALLDEWCHILHHPRMLHMNIEETIPVALAWRRDASASVELFREALLYVFQNQKM